MKITVRISISGDSLTSILREARKELEKFDASANWTIAEVDTYGTQDAAARDDGLVLMFSATVVAEATIEASQR